MEVSHCVGMWTTQPLWLLPCPKGYDVYFFEELLPSCNRKQIVGKQGTEARNFVLWHKTVWEI